MPAALILVLLICCPTLLAAADPKPPSEGARGMCGAMGVVTYIPSKWQGKPIVETPGGPTTWWKDTDGIDPGTPGCHLELAPNGETGRSFGEACLANGLLVETNPGKGVVHSHGNDVGHPDTFDCNLWCRCQGAERGHCGEAEAKLCGKSASCVCGSG